MLDDDGNTSFCHEISTLNAVEHPRDQRSLCFGARLLDVTSVTDVGEEEHTSPELAGKREGGNERSAESWDTPPTVTSVWHKTQWMVRLITAIGKAVD